MRCAGRRHERAKLYGQVMGPVDRPALAQPFMCPGPGSGSAVTEGTGQDGAGPGIQEHRGAPG